MNIAVFASHGGSDLQAIIDGCKQDKLDAKVAVVISNNGDSMALERAKKENIPAYHLSSKVFGSEDILADEILKVLSEYDIDMIFLAGYMRLLHISILTQYNNRVFNIHPALLPKFAELYGMPLDTIIAMGAEINGSIHNVSTFVMICVAPLNVVKGTMVSILTMLLYKRVARPLFGIHR